MGANTPLPNLYQKTAAKPLFLHSCTPVSQLGDSYPRLYPRGLDEASEYSIQAIVGKLDSRIPKQASGDYWMHHGIEISLQGDYQATLFTLEKEGMK
jgi:alpha-galactosidase